MSDLLDLRSDPPQPRGRRRRRRLGPLPVLGLVLVLLVGLVLGGRAVLDTFRSPDIADYSGSGSGEVVVQVQPNATASDVARTLLDKGVVKSVRAFTAAALDNPDSRKLQPGTYALHRQMSGKAALALLLDPSSRLRGRVVVPEGFTVTQTLARIASSTDIPLAQLQAAAKDTRALGLPSYAKGLEGFLFPATYEVEPGTTASEVLQTMVQRFDKAAAETGLEQRSAALGMTPYEVVTVASLIEREVRLKDELPKVARVVYNRLDRGEPLGIDAALLYGLGRTSGAIKQSELASDNPYNLRRRKGLPPTPIASPGEATLKAALGPAQGDWLYYVLADKSGRTLFTASYDEFLKQKAKSQREGVF